jgi:hypothetical protein
LGFVEAATYRVVIFQEMTLSATFVSPLSGLLSDVFLLFFVL